MGDLRRNATRMGGSQSQKNPGEKSHRRRGYKRHAAVLHWSKKRGPGGARKGVDKEGRAETLRGGVWEGRGSRLLW